MILFIGLLCTSFSFAEKATISLSPLQKAQQKITNYGIVIEFKGVVKAFDKNKVILYSKGNTASFPISAFGKQKISVGELAIARFKIKN